MQVLLNSGSIKVQVSNPSTWKIETGLCGIGGLPKLYNNNEKKKLQQETGKKMK